MLGGGTFCQPLVFTHSFSPRNVCVGFLDRIAYGFWTEVRRVSGPNFVWFLDRIAYGFWTEVRRVSGPNFVWFLDRIAYGFWTEFRMVSGPNCVWFLDRSAEGFWTVEEWGLGAELRSAAI
jgi:hypothetical protein